MDIVPGCGPRTAKIMIVGEAPAAEEVRLGKPFMGRAGEEMNNLLRSAGINRDECYITNASLYPVPYTDDAKGKHKHFFGPGGLTPKFLESYTQLMRDIAEIKPNVIIALGGYAMWACSNVQTKQPGSGVLTYRGSVLTNPMTGTKVIPTIHPAALLRGKNPYEGGQATGGLWKYRTVVIWDLQKAKKESAFPEVRQRPRTLIVNPEGGEREEAIARLWRAKELTVDIETHGGLKLACIGFSDGDPEWAVTFRNNSENFALFKGLLETDVPKVGQNLMYDVTMLDQIGIHTKNVSFDTMLAQHVLLVELPKGLDFLASIYTDMPYYKDEGKIWREEHNAETLLQFYRYNSKDVCVTSEVKREQVQELKASNLWHVMQRRMRAFEPLRWATYRGDTVDLEQFRAIRTETEREMEAIRLFFDNEVDEEFNPNSPKQVAELIYDVRKLPPRYKDKKLTTDERALMDLAAKTKDPVCIKIVQYRQIAKKLSTAFNEDIISPDGQLRSSYNIAGTVSGRLSSSAPLWAGNAGDNGQNRTEELKRCLIAPPGYECAEIDQSQAEAIVTAYLANDPVHIDCFRHNKDVHRVTMCLIEGIPLDQWASIPKKHPRRQLYKKGNHAFNYNVGPDTFMYVVNAEYDPNDPNSLVINQTEARQFHEMYHKMRPALAGWWESVRTELRRDKTLTTPSPLLNQRVFLDAWSDTLLREAYSWKPQSTVGECSNIAMSNIHFDPDMQALDVKVLGQVHDSVRLIWPKSNREEVLKRLWPLAETELYIEGYRVVVPWEGFVGDSFDKSKMENFGMSRICCEVGYGD